MKRHLGQSGLEVSAIGMRCGAIGGPWAIHRQQAGWGEVDDGESIRAIQRALEMGQAARLKKVLKEADRRVSKGSNA